MKKHLPSLSSWVCCHTLALLLSAASMSASDPATYAGLKPDEFMRNWLVLKPIPVSAGKLNMRNWLVLKPIPVAAGKSGEPSEEVQKKAFAEDSLKGQGGEAKAHPRT